MSTEYENLPAEQEEPKLSKQEKKLAKYKEDMDGISLEKDKFANGVVQDRSCTDLFCLIVFLVFLGSMGGVTVYSISQGQVSKFMAPIGMGGNFCGVEDSTRKDYPKLYFTKLGVQDASDILNSGICMKKCPEQGATIDVNSVHPDDKQKIIDYNNDYKDANTYHPPGAYASHEVLDYCMPSVDKLETQRPDEVNRWKMAFSAMTADGPGAKLNDLYLSSRAIYWSMALSFFYCILYIYLLSIFAEYLAWGLVFVTQIGLFVFAAGSMMAWNTAKSSESTFEQEKANGYLISGIVASLFALIFLLMICCGYSQLKTAIDVIDASADFVAKTKRIILVPIGYFFVTMIIIGIWLGAIMCIFSMGTITAGEDQKKDISFNGDDKLEKKVFYMTMFMFFGILWIVNFIKAKSSFITMVSASTYYFDSNSEKDGEAQVMQGFKFAYMYHAGSIALGSFIIALIQFIRIVFMVLAEQAQKASGDNAAVKIIVKIGECILACIEKICDYINTNAYGYQAITGESFCSSAWNGFLLNMRHGLEFAWANFIASMFILLGKLGIVMLNTFSCYMIMKHVTKDLEEITSPSGPLLVVALVTFAAANIFLGLFDEAVIAMLMCLCVDKEINGGEAQYGPPTFHDSADKGSKPKTVGDDYGGVNNDMA